MPDYQNIFDAQRSGAYLAGLKGSGIRRGNSWYDAVNEHGGVLFTSYSGSDIKATITMPGVSGPLHLGNLRAISVSTRRQVVPVPVIGGTNIRGMTRGHRIIAGSLVFASFNKYVFHLIDGAQGLDPETQNILADMLPPFDITITQVNEYGNMSQVVVRGVTIVDEGIVFSSDDIFSEQTNTYLARDMYPVRDITEGTNRMSEENSTMGLEL